MTFRHFEPIDESWKHGGVMWQVLYDGADYDVSTSPLCTNCLCELDNSLKCSECGKQHKLTMDDKLAAATQASKSYNAAKRRKTYTITAPQIGQKIADVDLDLPDSEFMNVTLEERKGTKQVVITVGGKGEKKKAQIFVDLTKHEIRHDQNDLSPDQFVNSIELNGVEQTIKKQFRHTSTNASLEHPYIYVSGSSHNNTEITLGIKSDESEEYFLERVEMEGTFSSPNRSLIAKSITRGIRISVTHPLESEKPKIRLIVSRGGRSFIIEQDIRTERRADGKYNLQQWVERPSSIKELDK